MSFYHLGVYENVYAMHCVNQAPKDFRTKTLLEHHVQINTQIKQINKQTAQFNMAQLFDNLHWKYKCNILCMCIHLICGMHTCKTIMKVVGLSLTIHQLQL